MGGLDAPNKREKYNIKELLCMVEKYEKIQKNIDALEGDIRVTDFPHLRLSSLELDVDKLT
jgi:hypothetical protein